MSLGLEDPYARTDTVVTEQRPPGSRTAQWRRYLGVPALLALVCVGVVVFVAFADLDDVERRLLTFDGLRTATLVHLELVGLSTLLVIVLAVPLGILVSRPWARRLTPVVVGLGNIAQSVPSLGVIVLFAILFAPGFGGAVVALVVYAFLPILRNTIVGLQQIDPFVVESARGMGMSSNRVLREIELPLAVPVILAGVRTAAVIGVGTATIGALTNAGGLGSVVYGGIVQSRTPVIVVASILTAVLALLVDHVLGVAENVLRPRGL
ncbi:ABC transporter permease [Pseudonocardia xinjiangensis]|uniref:ABC transporter permease n=1 Tax=Pseudonocardia xinjiangensis TaxID=75289 RepID=UPI001B7D1884|nr:ABC transporter permease [Pseudonocardia xinjiangensis]